MVFASYFPNSAFLPYRSCFLQLLCRVIPILHTLCLISVSLTAMSLACSPSLHPIFPAFFILFCCQFSGYCVNIYLSVVTCRRRYCRIGRRGFRGFSAEQLFSDCGNLRDMLFFSWFSFNPIKRIL